MSKSANAIETLSATLTGMFTPDAEPVRDNNARRTESIKDSAGGQVVAQVKEASKRTPKGKSANKPGNRVHAGGRAAEQNGIKSPGKAGACSAAWDLFDAHPETTSAQLLDYAEAMGLNLGNLKCELPRWRKFNGVQAPAARATK